MYPKQQTMATRKFVPYKPKKPVTASIAPMSTFEMEDIFCNNVTIERKHPTTLIMGLYNLNQTLIADVKLGVLEHEFTPTEAANIAAVEFACLN